MFSGGYDCKVTVDCLLTASARRWPHKAALSDAACTISYEQLDRLSSRVAHMLRAHNVGFAARVAVLLPNSVEFVAIFFAVSRVGATLVPLNPGYLKRELENIFEETQPALIFARSAQIDLLREFAGEAKLFAIDNLELLTDLVATASESNDFDRLSWNEKHCILFTSGTTGKSKGAQLSHRSRVLNSLSGRLGYDINFETRVYCPAPLFHSGGMLLGLLNVIAAGGTVLFPRSNDVEEALRILVEQQANLLVSVPTSIYRFVHDSAFTEVAKNRHLSIIHGGTAMPLPLIEKLKESWPRCRPYHGYGATEFAQVSVLSPDEYWDHPLDTGRALPGVDLRVVDEHLNDVQPGQVGEVVTAGPHVFDGYLNDPAKTSQVMRGGYFWTGDLAVTDGSGRFKIVGRSTDMVITGGYNVYAKEVEDVLLTHPAIEDAAVFGVPDQEWGETVVAAVIRRSGHSCSALDLEQVCARALTSYKRPRRYFFVEEFPRTPIGKVQKSSLAKVLAS